MMKPAALFLAGALTLLAGAALAALPSVLQHPWKVTRADGSSFMVTFMEDGSYTTDVGVHGVWKLSGDQLCVTRSTGESNCIEAKADAHPGDTWKSQDAAGAAVTVELEQ